MSTRNCPTCNKECHGFEPSCGPGCGEKPCSECQERHHRPGSDAYLMFMAKVAATRGTCTRKKVGAVIAQNGQVVATGYNGSIRGSPHCTEVGCMMEHDHCVRTTHAEANAIVSAARNGVSIEGATLYTTASPCWLCSKLIFNSGIKRVVYAELYRKDDRIFEAAELAGVELVLIPHLPSLTEFL